MAIRLFVFFMVTIGGSFLARAQSSVPGLSNQSEYYCVSGALYSQSNRRLGTFSTQKKCLKAVYFSKWGLVCSGGGTLVNVQGLLLDSYFDQELCLTSLWYSSFSPSRICSGRILKNLAGGFITSFPTAEDCLEAMGMPPK